VNITLNEKMNGKLYVKGIFCIKACKTIILVNCLIKLSLAIAVIELFPFVKKKHALLSAGIDSNGDITLLTNTN
jgi:hypothetical protein